MLGVAGTIVIGTSGPAALAAITGATAVFVAIARAVYGLGQGAGILAGQAVGADN
jgi:Na+-driven multidrug efflux pump